MRMKIWIRVIKFKRRRVREGGSGNEHPLLLFRSCPTVSPFSPSSSVSSVIASHPTNISTISCLSHQYSSSPLEVPSSPCNHQLFSISLPSQQFVTSCANCFASPSNCLSFVYLSLCSSSPNTSLLHLILSHPFLFVIIIAIIFVFTSLNSRLSLSVISFSSTLCAIHLSLLLTL